MYLLLYNNFIVFASLLISFYASITAPKLPNFLIMLLDNIFIKIIIVFVISYKFSKEPFIALIASILLLVVLIMASLYEKNKSNK